MAKAKKYYKTYQIVALIVGITLVILSWLFRLNIVSIFTKSEEARQAALAIWLIKLPDIVTDIQKGLQCGMVQALTLQKKVLYVKVLIDWVFNVPLILLLSFKFKMGLTGIWVAKVIKEITMYLATYYIIWR